MKSKIGIIVGVLVALLSVTGFVVYQVLFTGSPTTQETTDQITPTSLPPVDAAISVDLVKTTTAPNTVTILIKGMASKMATISYELSYESQGLVKGVNSGSKPADVTAKDTFTRDIYLGTCSRNDCKPDIGVKTVSLVVEFTDTAGKKSQFTKEYEL